MEQYEWANRHQEKAPARRLDQFSWLVSVVSPKRLFRFIASDNSSGYAVCNDVTGDVADDDRTCANHRVASNLNTLDNHSSDSEVRQRTEAGGSAYNRIGSDMHEVADVHVVLDDSAGIHDRPDAKSGTGVYCGLGHHHTSCSEFCIARNGSGRVNHGH